MREIIIDTETTGLHPAVGHRIIEMAAREMINGKLTGHLFHGYFNPDFEISEEAFRVHGISNEFLKRYEKFTAYAEHFLDFIQNSVLVIHNAPFDIPFINKELREAGKEIIGMERVKDTKVIARNKFPGEHYSLDALCQRFGISLEGRAKHGALIDTELLAYVYQNLTQ